MRAKPERTQLDHLSDASFLGKLLVLPANVRLDWKVIARYKHSSLFGLVVKRGAQKLTGENLKPVLGRVFNYKLGCYDDVHVNMYMDAHPYL